ncbi:ACT domain-containing protein [Aliiglaciecola sp. CAU 1673]|uniref:ACT domain-containing protein n=1 Tax=Aliiglaciecola sp. CAU 1673 TaxID=3032595 RepID=UPI0023DAD1D8|nr:ACT domain-containing protein [Aliiglaciecola sp. CAU 1673]MDF2180308.1 ACT domain-containing protein [Aliiglaciecola sp. CAU 1673]
MQGESNLNQLIANMQPVLKEPVFVFVTLPKGQSWRADVHPKMVFMEEEGTTLIVEREVAEAQRWDYAFPCRMITLNIHSSLEAVGFLARITAVLARLEMGVNPVSAFYHDHLFVPEDRADEAVTALQQLSLQCRLKD